MSFFRRSHRDLIAPHAIAIGCNMTDTFLSDVQVASRYGVHRATPWRWVKSDPTFPKPVSLTPGCTRWRLSEIEAWESLKAKPSPMTGRRLAG